MALVFQYGLAPNLDAISWDYFIDAWTSGCGDDESLDVCSGNAGVFRAAGAAFVFFFIFGIAAKCKPSANREAWPAKYVLFLFLCIGTMFIPNDPIFIPIFLWIARIGSFLFVLVQQLILVDVAYNWNSAWLDKADQAELAEGPGKGKKWLTAILLSCGILYALSIAGIVIMYLEFGGCTLNEVFVSITLALSCICTIVQLTISETGSLLASACMTLYATYICAAAVTKNPNPVCNPRLGENSVWSIVLGLLIAFISLMWVGWSNTTDERLGAGKSAENGNNASDEEKQRTGGVVINNESTGPTEAAPQQSPPDNPASFGSSWKLNAVMCVICCWYAMSLTGWGATSERGDIANPDKGKVSMWMLIASQWIALLLYLWTLLAPTLFPNRDFS